MTRSDPPSVPPRVAWRLALTLLLATLLTTAFATDYPVTVTDDLGAAVTLERAPQRIVAMIPSHTETVCALGACERLVGRDQFSNFPAEVVDLPDLGSAFSANVEALVALEPDLVLVDQFSGLAATLRDLGLTVYAGTGQSLEGIYAVSSELGLLLDRETAAALLNGRIRGQVRAVAERAEALPSPEVYYELDATPYSVGPGSYIGTLIDLAGGSNIVPAELGDFPQLDPEFVVAADPDLIVLADAPFGESAATVAARPGWSSIDAVEDGDVVELTQAQIDAINRPGPRVGEAILLLARIFHPGSF